MIRVAADCLLVYVFLLVLLNTENWILKNFVRLP